MKKFVLFFILIICLLIPAYSETQAGLSVGHEWFKIFSVEGINADDYGQKRLLVNLDGATYFGSSDRSGGFGIEYGFGSIISLGEWQGDVSVRAQGFNAGYMAKFGLGYRHAFSDLFGLSVGLGVYGTYDSEKGSDSGNTYEFSEFDLFMYGKAAVDLTFGQSFRINLGANVGGPVWAHATIQYGVQSVSGEIEMSGIFFTPFISLSYVH